MIIGIDFDNTLVNYDDLFYIVAVKKGFINPDDTSIEIGKSKNEVRDYFRKIGKEELWTELQGLAYGKHIDGAKIFPGIQKFFHYCKSKNIKTYIVSHKTRYPYLGEKHDLHEAAMFWLESNGFFEGLLGMKKSEVFLELTKEEKIDRIKKLKCDYFIDDLPELLLMDSFPDDVGKILFDPNKSHENNDLNNKLIIQLNDENIVVKNSWDDITKFFGDLSDDSKDNVIQAKSKGDHEFDDNTLQRIDGLLYDYDSSNIENWNFTRILGGKNNRAYKIERYDSENKIQKTLLMKVYHHNVKDGRNRIDAEFSFLKYCENLEISFVPLPIKRGDNIALYSFIEGRKCDDNDLNEINVKKFIHFFAMLNENRITNDDAQNLDDASEACFNIDGHLSMVDSRVDRLKNIDPSASEINSEAVDFISSKLIPKWHDIQENILSETKILKIDTRQILGEGNTCISPSDFGFHNALIGKDDVTGTAKSLYFLDFEYAGIDDPAKLVNDFFARPDPAPDIKYYDLFLETISDKNLFSDIDGFINRSKLLLPLYRIKWCCIMLNEFLKSDSERRKFAVSDDIDAQKIVQLEKTKKYFEKNLENN